MNELERIEALRQHALECKPNHNEWRFLFQRALLESYDSETHTGCRYGLAVKTMLANVEPVIGENELIVGKPSGRSLTPEEDEQWQNILEYAVPGRPRMDGQASHMAVDYELLLEKGAEGIMEHIDGLMKSLDAANPDEQVKLEFYRSCKFALEGLLLLGERYSAYALKLSESCQDSRRKAELLEISKVCAQVPRFPARSFYEAVQSVHFLTFCLSCSNPGGLYQLGRPDRYLYKYYTKDIEKGAITPQQAQLLIDCLGILYNEYIPSSLAVGLMVGGYDENGANVENQLTFMFIESIRRVKMIYPGVGLCYNSQTSRELLKLACEILSEGHSHPALFNDEVIIKGLKHYGLSDSEACSYIHSTCVEITPVASSACWVASPYTNLLQLLLDTINIEEPTEFTSYDELEEAYFSHLAGHIRKNLIEQNSLQIERSLHFYDPLLSCFVKDCLAKGVDIEHGGARYNWIMPSFVGVANLADSLHVIRELVFSRKKFSLAQLAAMLKNNFEGYEAQRALIKNKIPKYGNDDDTADDFVARITKFISAECEKYKTHRGGRLIPSLFCWIIHEQFGTETMATPDGRPAAFPLGDGSGPAQGNEKNGPTASILSSTKWEHYPFIGGIAVNMKFSKKTLSSDSFESMEALIKTFMERGGFELQVNVVDKETLLRARQNPQDYSDLVVRIGGYSDFFVRLTPAMQQEVIERSEHTI